MDEDDAAFIMVRSYGASVNTARPIFQVLDDHPFEDDRECGICAGMLVTPSSFRDWELREFGVNWDPTIRF